MLEGTLCNVLSGTTNIALGITDKTLEECKSLCQNDGGCITFNFRRNGNVCEYFMNDQIPDNIIIQPNVDCYIEGMMLLIFSKM